MLLPDGYAWFQPERLDAELEPLRESICSFLAFDRGRNADLMGSGFCVETRQNGISLCLTAKHVLEYAQQHQEPDRRHNRVPHVLDEPPPRLANINPNGLRIIWRRRNEGGGITSAFWANQFDNHDVAGFACHTGNPGMLGVGLDLRPISKGEEVVVISNRFRPDVPPGQHVLELREPDAAGNDQLLQWDQDICVRVGRVREVYPNGYERNYTWPCFSTTIPVPPGMSGGLVARNTNAGIPLACGIVCADVSSTESETDMHIEGESIISMPYLALPLHVPLSAPVTDDTERMYLLDMFRAGLLRPPAGDLGIFGIDRAGNLTIRD